MLTPSAKQFKPARVLLGYIRAYETIRLRWILTLIACSILLPVIVAFASYIDGTWVLPQDGKGFKQHWGMWSFFATTPVILLLLAILLHRCEKTLDRNLRNYCVGGVVPPTLRRTIELHLASLTMRTKLKFVFFLMCCIGVYFTILNILRTIEPSFTYGNDVFDAYQYTLGFTANKLYLLFVFGLVYPAVAYITVHTTVSLFVILKRMQREKILSIDFFHVDNCGGFSRFGTINLFVMIIYLCLLSVIVALIETHDYRQHTTTVPLLCTSAFLILQSLGTVYYLHKAVHQQRLAAVERVNEALNHNFSALPTDDFPNHLFAIRNHLLSVKTYPYSSVARSLVNIIRTAPAVWALARLWV